MDDETLLPTNFPADDQKSSDASPSAAASAAASAANSVDLNWVWREVRKRVFIKLPFSLGVADAMESVVPITLTNDAFICGLSSRDYPLSGHLHAVQVRNTVENILRQAARRPIRFELIEGTSLADWEAIQDRQRRAHSAVVAIAEKKLHEHHFDDVLNQIVSELRARILATSDRTLPQVRAHLMLELVPQLADIEEMLFADHETHDRRRAMTRAIDRIAAFLEVLPFTLALEVERYRLYPPLAAAAPIQNAPIQNTPKNAPASAAKKAETPQITEPVAALSIEQPLS